MQDLHHQQQVTCLVNQLAWKPGFPFRARCAVAGLAVSAHGHADVRRLLAYPGRQILCAPQRYSGQQARLPSDTAQPSRRASTPTWSPIRVLILFFLVWDCKLGVHSKGPKFGSLTKSYTAALKGLRARILGCCRHASKD